ncbi:MAG: signal peptide peptidase SppA [Planctomycetota bacterium]
MSRHNHPRASCRLILLGSGVALALLSGCMPTSFLITPVSALQELDEKVVLRESVWATRKVALVDVDGLLQNQRSTPLIGVGGDNPVALFAEKLEQAAKDRNVRAVVVRINSPGGTVTASELMYTELLSFRQRTHKPVIAAMLDVAASGGYYVACAADAIYAQPTTVTGSIGVIMLAPEFSGTLRKIGAEVNVIKSGEMKDLGSLFREMTPADRAILQKLIDGMYAQFVAVVARARPQLERERLLKLADGRVYLAPEAKELGLVDEVGTLHDAILAAKRAAGLADHAVKVVEYARNYEYRPNIYAAGQAPPAQVNLVNIELPNWLTGPAPQFLYVWAPGWHSR